MLSYFSRVGPRPESSGSISSLGGFDKELPRTPVKDGKDGLSSDEEKKIASPTQLRLEELGTHLPISIPLRIILFIDASFRIFPI
jgi:hypothetical protein